ncbi:hypothetical protein SAMN05216189_10231, partial [Pseudomonas delhiensis]
MKKHTTTKKPMSAVDVSVCTTIAVDLA